MASKLSSGLLADQLMDLVRQQVRCWVTDGGRVVCKHVQSGHTGTGRSVRLAYEEMEKARA